MSREHFGYQEWHMINIKEQIIDDIKKYSHEYIDEYNNVIPPFDPDVIKSFQCTVDLIAECFKRIQDINSLMSGDDSVDTFRECVRSWK